RLRLLLEVNNTIASNLELRELLKAISANLRSLMQCDGVSVALPDDNGGQLRLRALDFPNGKGLIHEEARIVVDDDSPAALVYRTGEAISAVEGEPNWAVPRLAEAEGVKAICHVPLVSRNRKLGLLTLARLAPRPFSPHDLELLALVGNQVAIAVE